MSGKSKKTELRCAEIRDVLDLLAAGDLPEDEATRYRDHLASCAACRARYSRIVESSGAVRAVLTEGAVADIASVDLWPAVRERIHHRRRFSLPWLSWEPVRTLTAAAALTVGIFILAVYQRDGSTEVAQTPLYESTPVIVAGAKIGGRPARVSGFQSGDGETVFLWLE